MAKLTRQNLAVLLSGKSLNELASVIQELGDAKQIAFAAINRKAHIERNILDPINRKIDLWCILNPREFLHEIGNVRLFLADDRENLLLTSSSALGSAIDLIRYHPLPGFEKILLLDDWIYRIYDFYYVRHRRQPKSLLAVTGEISTLFILLHYFASAQFCRNVYLFGCDGARAADTALNSELYFMQDTYDRERLEASAIYRDMVTLETEWGPSAEVLLTDRGIEMPNIVNANVASYYTLFERRAMPAVIAEIKSLPKSDELKLHGYKSWKELMDKVSDELALHRLALTADFGAKRDEYQGRILELLNEIKQENAAIRAQSDMLLNEMKQESAAIRGQLASLLPTKMIRALRQRFFGSG